MRIYEASSSVNHEIFNLKKITLINYYPETFVTINELTDEMLGSYSLSILVLHFH